MSATCIFRTFFRDESGAASVDWVVLAAACVALGLGVTNVVAREMSNLSQEIRAELQRDMMNNPFDEAHALATNGCAFMYLDPAADRAAYANANTQNGCAVGGGNGNGNGNGPQGNNGWGNGDQDAPGNSGPNNNAENSSYTVVITDQ